MLHKKQLQPSVAQRGRSLLLARANSAVGPSRSPGHLSSMCFNSSAPLCQHLTPVVIAWRKRGAERRALGSGLDAPNYISVAEASQTVMPNSMEMGKHDPSVGAEEDENKMMMKVWRLLQGPREHGWKLKQVLRNVCWDVLCGWGTTPTSDFKNKW